MAIISIALALAISTVCNQDAAAFVPPSPSFLSIGILANHQQQHHHQRVAAPQHQQLFQLFSTTEDLQSEISSMRVGALKQELESYGISTRAFLEKGELVDALVQARKEGKTPIATASAPSSSPSSSSSASSSSASESSSTSSSSSTNSAATPTAAPIPTAERTERIETEREKCKSLKVGELKSELESLGISTASFFEKSEFVRALADARVDGVSKKSKKKKRREVVDEDEVEEVSAKVEVITDDSMPKTKKNRDAADASPAGGGNPFGGMGGGGGMPGGMGGIADMLKGMGGMGGGGGGGNPFAGMGGGMPGGMGGGMPGGMGGDPMKAAQQAMSNPKVMAVIQKAQKNPKVMQAVQECMGNPMAMAKYMSDPDVGPILKELQDAMK